MVSNIFLCAYWPSVCFLWENVYSHLLPIFYLGSILKEISPGHSLDGLMLKLKLQYFGHLMWRADSLEKTLMLGKIEGKRRRGRQGEMVGWYHRLNGFGRTPGVGDRHGGLACGHSWGCKELDMTERLNWTELFGVCFFDFELYELLIYFGLVLLFS